MYKIRGLRVGIICLSTIPMITMFISCAYCSITLQVKDIDDKPINGMRVERYRPASFFEKLFNPIGTTYHQLSLAKSGITDTNGIVIFKSSSPKDVYRIYDNSMRSLNVLVWGKRIQVSPHNNYKHKYTEWVYSVWLEDNGEVQYTATAVGAIHNVEEYDYSGGDSSSDSGSDLPNTQK